MCDVLMSVEYRGDGGKSEKVVKFLINRKESYIGIARDKDLRHSEDLEKFRT